MRPLTAISPPAVVPAAASPVDWLAELAAGSDSALGRVVEQWGRPLHRFVYRYVQDEAAAADLVQETFVRVYQQRGRYRPGGSPGAWLFTIAANLCHNHRRWLGRHPTVSLAMPEGGESPGIQPVSPLASPADGLVRAETAAAVRAAIDALPHDLKVTLLLFEYDDLSYADIGRVVGCSPRGVETRLLRARARLRGALRELWREIHPDPAAPVG